MADWQAADAKQRFSELVDAAITDGPQTIMRHKDVVAVLVSASEYRILKEQADANFAELLAQSPFSPEDLEPVGMRLAGGG